MSHSLLRRLIPIARTSYADPDVQPYTGRQQGKTRQGTVVLVLVAVVVVLDQAAKWWAWRHVPSARINSGGDALIGPRIGAWYAAPVPGAVLDLLDFGLLSVAVSALARSRTAAAVRVAGALMIGGWFSNLMDRLGVHYWTAPGSVRGVVDFIDIGGSYYNLADFFIIGCTALFLLAAGYEGVREARRLAASSRARARILVPAVAGVGLVLVVALGAANYGGVNAAPRTQNMNLDHGRTVPCLLAGIKVSATRATHSGCYRHQARERIN